MYEKITAFRFFSSNNRNFSAYFGCFLFNLLIKRIFSVYFLCLKNRPFAFKQCGRFFLVTHFSHKRRAVFLLPEPLRLKR